MKPQDFVKAYLQDARNTEAKTGVSAIAILAQAALESGWGSYAPGNMFFGQKDFDGLNGNEQLCRTVEYSRRADLKFPVIHSINPVVINGIRYFKYDIEDYFRKYESPEDCFIDHVNFLIKNTRYAQAMLVKSDPIAFLTELAKAGYASAPNYAATMTAMVKSINLFL